MAVGEGEGAHEERPRDPKRPPLLQTKDLDS